MLRKIWKLSSIICCFSLTTAFVFAESLDAYLSSLQPSLLLEDAQHITTKQLIQQYCAAIEQSPSFVSDDFVYNSQQSVFVFLLCSHVRAVSLDAPDGFSSQVFFQGTSSSTNKGIFKSMSWSGIGIGNDSCSYSTHMNSCDLSKVLPPLFTTIINDYTNIKEASLYGVSETSLTKESLPRLVDRFASQYFTPSTLLCGEGSRYPKTCRVMKNYLQSASKTLASVKLFYPAALSNWAREFEGKCSLGDSNYPLLPCGLFADKKDSLQGFTALMYNEQFYYRLFLNYYSLVISSNPQILSSSVDQISRNLFAKRTRIANELIWSQKALSSTIRSLRDIYAAFPLHIGFMMYQEDLVAFGKKLASLAEPIYTLYDKLRNVQQP